MQAQLIFQITHILNTVSLLIGFAELFRLRKTFKSVFSQKKYSGLMICVLVGVGSALASPAFPPLLILSLIALIGLLYVFDGAYNGGSDYMNFLVTLSLCLYIFSDNEKIKMAALLYIGAQALLSYFMAGLSKALKPGWRNGENLKKIIEQSHYLIPTGLFQSIKHYKILSSIVIVSELSVVLGFLNFYLGVFLIAVFLIFHFINIRLLKLNRFFFAWLSSYACMAYCFYKA